jgi:uncharacterized membrane protein YcaP (DUF421 family)
MNIFDVDWKPLFSPDVPLLESFIRGTILYFFVFIIMRTTLRRSAGELAMLDFIFVLLVANGAADSMTGGAESLTNGAMIILTVVAWNYAMNTLSWHIPSLQRLTTPPPLQVIRDGEMIRKSMRREFITKEELIQNLREEGVEDISVVKSAYIEGDGNISVITYDESGPSG